MALIASIMFACSAPPQDNSAKNVALIEKYIKAVEELDEPTMESLLDDSYYGYGPSYGDSINKTQAVINWKDNLENLYESINYEKSRNVPVTITTGDNQGEWVSNWGQVHIVYKSKDAITLWSNSIYQIKNDKIVKSYTFYNEADALNQLGYVFINPSDL